MPLRLPAASAARVNAGLSDAAASDDSDIRNTAHYGTALTSAGLAIAERTGATGKDLLGAMVIGYEAAGRIGDARRGGRGGLHASQLVAFGGAVAVARLLKLTDQQMAHALGIVATTMGGIAIGTNSWAREYMGSNAAGSGVDAAEAAARGYTVNDDMLGARGGFVDVFGGGRDAVRLLSVDLGQRWDIVEFLAIKLWPGAHPFSGTLEAAVNAARQANVPADAWQRFSSPGLTARTSAAAAVLAIWWRRSTAFRTSWPLRSPTKSSPGSMQRRGRSSTPSSHD